MGSVIPVGVNKSSACSPDEIENKSCHHYTKPFTMALSRQQENLTISETKPEISPKRGKYDAGLQTASGKAVSVTQSSLLAVKALFASIDEKIAGINPGYIEKISSSHENSPSTDAEQDKENVVVKNENAMKVVNYQTQTVVLEPCKRRKVTKFCPPNKAEEHSRNKPGLTESEQKMIQECTDALLADDEEF